MAKTSDDYQGNDPRYPSQQQDRFIVRLPDGMRDRIKAAAERNNRSMNAEIVAALEEKFPKPRPFDLGTALTELGDLLKAVQTKAQFNAILAGANAELEENGSEWRIEATMKNGEVRVTIVRKPEEV